MGDPQRLRRLALTLTAFAGVMAAGVGVSIYLRTVFARSTSREYVERYKGAAELVDAGAFRFDNQSYACTRIPTVLNKAFPDYGAAYFGFIILNPDRFATLPLSVKRFAYAHECGHQYVGYSEVAADCYAVKRGLVEGWLDAESFEEVCAFFVKSKGTAFHLPGPLRCNAIRQCYEAAKTK